MKVLWFINSILPEMTAYIAGSVYNGASASNSWIKALVEVMGEEVDLTIAMFYKGDAFVENRFDGFYGIAVPFKGNVTRYRPGLDQQIKQVINMVSPDVIHIHGTEYPYVRNVFNVSNPEKVVVSIQGLISEISKYYLSGLSFWDIFSNLTIRNIVFHDSIWGQKREFERRGKNEIKSIGRAKYVMGRTLWDYVHAHQINPNLHYFHLDELLRSDFYGAPKWEYEKCKKHTIFVSQCSYPIKGLHFLLQAVAAVKVKYPDVRLRIAGKEFIKRESLFEKLKFSGYAKYISKLIKQLDLEGAVEFVGVLDSKGMIREYLSANVFVCPSVIENSPNSMCEAQMLGVPSVVSFVGGICDMTNWGETANIYRCEDFGMLSHFITTIFDDYRKEEARINKGILKAEQRHNREEIVKGLLRIYDLICSAQ